MAPTSVPNDIPPRSAAPYLVQVKQIDDLSPHLRRITLFSDALRHYPAPCVAAHIKLFLPQSGQRQPVLPTLTEKGPVWPEGAVRPIVRTYTVRNLRAGEGEIDIEFAMHDGSCPALDFARSAQPGDWIGLSNPGGPKPMLPPAQRYYLVGDGSALPAIAALLEDMPEHTTGQAFIRVAVREDCLALKKPAGLQISWFVGSIETSEKLIAAFIASSLPVEDSHFWLAGENRLVVELRRYLRREKACRRQQLYAIPYWHEGLNEEGYHHRRHEIMDNIDG